MAKFIEVNETLINIENISKAEFISDDIYLGLFPKTKNGEISVDYVDFTYAKLYLTTGEVIDFAIDLFQPEEDEEVEAWCDRNKTYINMSWYALKEALKDITVVTGFEYKYGV